MRYSVLGFNQEQIVESGLSMNDALLLSYIYEAQASTEMEHKLVDGYVYTWLYHDKILKDLPILDVKEDRLKQMLRKLSTLGLIKSTRETRNMLNGSKAFYGITEKCEAMRYDRGVKNYTSGGVKNYTSDSQLQKDTNTTNISKDILDSSSTKSSTVKKKNLYEGCVDEINSFTQDTKLRELLVDFLKICLENSRESGKPFYKNTFKGKLNLLKGLSDNTDMQIRIVQQTLDNGWAGFYEIKEDTRRRRNTGNVAEDIEGLNGGLNNRAEKRGMISGKKY